MPATKEIVKNKRERVRVGAYNYGGHDLVDIRIYVPFQGNPELTPTRKGVMINVDLVPELIAALEWALAQDCSSDIARRIPAKEQAEKLAGIVWQLLGAHGSAVHWDAIEQMVKGHITNLSKWDLHYVLVTRRDLFQSSGGGTFKAIGYHVQKARSKAPKGTARIS